MANSLLAAAIFVVTTSASLVTPAAQLHPRATDPAFVGYVSENGGFGESRVCDYTATLSTTNGYVQCCPTSGACNFWTACSSNTLVAAGGSTVPCDYTSTLTCNTAIVLPTAGATNGGKYLGCWQTSLGMSPFTFVQDIGTAVPSPSSSGTASSTTANLGSSSSSSGQSTTGTVGSSSSSSSSASHSSSSGAAWSGHAGVGGGVAGALALIAQALL